MLEENRREAALSGITHWHNQGYKGQGLTIAIMDSDFESGIPFLKGMDVHIAKFGYGDKEGTSHGSAVAHIVHQILPYAWLVIIPPRTEALDWCIANNVDIINLSMKLSPNEEFKQASQHCIDTGIILLTSAGNTVEDWMLGVPARYEQWIAAGAVHLMYRDTHREKIIRADYSSYTRDNREVWEMVEVMGFSGVDILSPKNLTRSFTFNGTSGSSPWIAGMCGLIKMIIPDMNQQGFRDFIKKNCMYLEEEGYDRFTGHGLFILPKLEEFKEDDNMSEEIKFTDIEGHWAEEEIKEGAKLGMLKGYPDGTFKPDQPQNQREELIASWVGSIPTYSRQIE